MPRRKSDPFLTALDLPALAVGSSADTSTLFTYHFNAANLGTFDPLIETVIAACLTTDSAVTGAATNNFQVNVTHYNKSATVVDQITYTFGSGTNASAFIPIDLSGAASGSLAVPTGKGINVSGGWQLAAGDSIVVKRATNGTGLASPAFTVTILIGIQGA